MAAMNLDERWNKVARELLVGRRIVEVSYMSREEAAGLGWSKRPVVLILDDGTLVYAASDDEGNNGAPLFSSDRQHPILPVL